ncbi:DUF3617 domain-containing protein [Sphingomonas sp. RB3P16]|uniref:DUF3617 domain-containing protein n=1 Tax=Parasphingomonas frigoris TaxID=3096163 RepID=UPI002FC7B899
MQGTGWIRAGVAALVLVGGIAAAKPTGGPPLAAIARIEAGQWQLKPIDSSSPPRMVCIGDARALIQFGHGSTPCQHTVVSNDANVATVQYACPGIGHGLTSVKVATQRNFNLETQGILNGAPFDEQYEARRVGACPAGAAPLR